MQEAKRTDSGAVSSCVCIVCEEIFVTIHVCPEKTQISLGIHPVWSESSLSAWRKLESLATHWAHSEDSDHAGQMPRLIGVFASHTVISLVLSSGGSHVTRTYPFLQRVPFRQRIIKLVIIKVYRDLAKKIISAEPVVMPYGNPQGTVLQLTFWYRILQW